MEKRSRRDLLVSGWKLGAALLTGAAGWTTYEVLRPFTGSTGTGPVELGPPESFPAGSATYFPEGRLYVVNVKDWVFALSQRCPHLGCKVPFCETSGRFECPCHGSIFDLGGEYIAGPSPRGMDRYQVEVHQGVLAANTDARITGPDRGVKDFFEPAKGPSCLEEA